MIVSPARTVNGNLRLPGDKSICHRYAMLAGIACGPSRFENFSTGADCSSTLDCLRELGVSIKRGDAPGVVQIEGQGAQLRAPSGPYRAVTPGQLCECSQEYWQGRISAASWPETNHYLEGRWSE